MWGQRAVMVAEEHCDGCVVLPTTGSKLQLRLPMDHMEVTGFCDKRLNQQGRIHLSEFANLFALEWLAGA